MKQSNTLRAIGGLSVCAVAAGFAVAIGGGIATAAPGSTTWTDQYSTFTRTIDNATPTGDDTVTVTTKWARIDSNWEKLNWVKDYHSTCLTYVSGSAKVTDAAGVHTIEPYVEMAADYTAVDFTSLGYQPTAKRGVDTPILSIQYKVGYDCDRGTILTAGLIYNGSRGTGIYTNPGPSIRVAKNTSTTTLDAVPARTKVGQTVPLSAAVTGGADGDIVEFYDGTTKIGESSLAAGKATMMWTPALGAHILTAKFLGTTKANESVSPAQNVPVAPADVATTTSVTGPATAVAGTDVILGVQVSPAPALGGKVQFKDGGTDIGGLVDLDTQGNASTTAALAAGNHAITAVFTGFNEHLASTSGAHNIAVTPANVDTTTTVTAPATATTGVEVELVVNVSPTSAGGTVQFMDGDNKIGLPVTVVNGKATLKHTFTSAGTSNITAVHSDAAGNVISTSEIRTVTVTDTETPGGGNIGGSLGNIFGS
ncbi:Ig-like domain-containing protein [Rhodococcus sp. OK302]|uniref:Ig-like domain-containing protein n=1 Tax=Rhodococcus sp. OK302 TaxID=1882769 RepID=UPI000B9425C4|nr:Ig-like domain-containing protein [Rhodococcus sp. OK302]OYD70337.1 Ig-like domain-containing protein [Rhodococcus sp. OK302]